MASETPGKFNTASSRDSSSVALLRNNWACSPCFIHPLSLSGRFVIDVSRSICPIIKLGLVHYQYVHCHYQPFQQPTQADRFSDRVHHLTHYHHQIQVAFDADVTTGLGTEDNHLQRTAGFDNAPYRLLNLVRRYRPYWLYGYTHSSLAPV